MLFGSNILQNPLGSAVDASRSLIDAGSAAARLGVDATKGVLSDPSFINSAATGTPYRSASGATGTAAAPAPAGDPDTAAYYQDMINNLNGQTGRLDRQQDVGLGNINDSYTTAQNRLNEQRGIAQRNYNTQTQQNTQNYSTTRNGVMSNTRATANALQRLLGLNGAGNSSAAYEQAPYAAGLQGSQNMNQAQQTYSNNYGALKNNWDDAELAYKNNLDDLGQQKYSQTNQLRSSIAQTRASLLDQISQADINRRMALGEDYEQARAARGGYESKINSLLDSIVGLGDQYQGSIKAKGNVNFKAPTLGQFSLGNFGHVQDTGGARSNVDPTFLNLISPEKRDEFGNPLV